MFTFRLKIGFFIFLTYLFAYYFSDKNIREEFSFFNLKDFNILWYLVSILAILLITRKIINKWIWKTVIISSIFFILSFKYSGLMASYLTKINVNKVEKLTYKNHKDIIFIFYGFTPTRYLVDLYKDISINDRYGLIRTYDMKTKTWSIHD